LIIDNIFVNVIYGTIVAVAVATTLLILTIMMIFSGFLVQLSSVSPWLSWMQWISAFRYAQNVLLINELKGLTFCLPTMSYICPTTGENILTDQLIDHNSSWDLWKYFLGLVLMSVFFVILAFVQLLRLRRQK